MPSSATRPEAADRVNASLPKPFVCVQLLSRFSDKTIMRVEFLGVPRERAGVSVLELQADTLGQLFAALAHRFPAFAELVSDNRLRPSMVANLNGDRFVSDPGLALNSDDCVLILSADAGG